MTSCAEKRASNWKLCIGIFMQTADMVKATLNPDKKDWDLIGSHKGTLFIKEI